MSLACRVEGVWLGSWGVQERSTTEGWHHHEEQHNRWYQSLVAANFWFATPMIDNDDGLLSPLLSSTIPPPLLELELVDIDCNLRSTKISAIFSNNLFTLARCRADVSMNRSKWWLAANCDPMCSGISLSLSHLLPTNTRRKLDELSIEAETDKLQLKTKKNSLNKKQSEH